MAINKNISQVLCSVAAALLISTFSGVLTIVVELARMGERQDRESLQLDKTSDGLIQLQIAVSSLEGVVTSQGSQISRIDTKLD